MDKKLLTILFFMVANVYARQKAIKLYAIYTPSHEIMLNEWFLPSIIKTQPPGDFEVILKKHRQECKTGIYKTSGWKKTTIKKVKMIIQAVKDNWNKIFVYSDVDIQFFLPIKKDLLERMKDNDLVVQQDDTRGRMCSGFFACRGSEKTLQLWQDVLECMQENEDVSDQGALNYCLIKKQNPYNIAWQFLPTNYFGGGTLTTKRWWPGDSLPIPLEIKIHHANWTHGVDNKIKQLEYVSKVVRDRLRFWLGKRTRKKLIDHFIMLVEPYQKDCHKDL